MLLKIISISFFCLSFTLFSQEKETYEVKKENLSKRVNFFWDKNKSQKQSSGHYYKDEIDATTMKHGKWRYYSKDGVLEEVRNYYKDLLHGEVVAYYGKNRPKQQGFFYMDKQDSAYKEWHENDQLKVEGEYNYGKPTGEWTYYYRDGHIKSIEETRNGIKYTNAFWMPDSLHTQTITDGDGEMRTFYTTGAIKEWYYYKDGQKHGKFEERSIYGYPTLTGEFQNGKKAGEWKYAYYTGETEKISHYKNDELQGNYQYFYDNGQLNVEGQYQKGEKTGQWTWYTNSGQKDMQGEFQNGEQHGDWTYWHPTGGVSYNAHYKKGLKSGMWTYFYKNQQKFKEGTFQEDKKHGDWKTWYEDGTLLMEGRYEHGLEEGEWTNYWENGEVKNKGNFSKGMLNGEWISNYPSGKTKLTGEYENGLKTGEWTDRFERGNTREIINYKIKQVQSKVNYGIMKDREHTESVKDGDFKAFSDKDGLLMEEGKYKDDVKTGEWKAFHPGGVVPAVVSNYKKGELNGTMETFDRRGNKISKGDYKNGRKHGKFRVFNDRGEVISEKKFKDGMEIIEGQSQQQGGFSPGN